MNGLWYKCFFPIASDSPCYQAPSNTEEKRIHWPCECSALWHKNTSIGHWNRLSEALNHRHTWGKQETACLWDTACSLPSTMIFFLFRLFVSINWSFVSCLLAGHDVSTVDINTMCLSSCEQSIIIIKKRLKWIIGQWQIALASFRNCA